MGRNHIHKYVIAYLEKTLPADHYGDVEKHIALCKSCKELVAKVASVYCGAEKECPELSPFFITKVETKLSSGFEPEYFLPVSIIKSLRPVALGLLLLTTVTFSVFMGNYLLSSKVQNSYTITGKESIYEYYLNVNEDQVVTQIINNEE